MEQLRRWLRPEGLCFVVVWLLILGLFRERGFYDPGALWHTRVGEIILRDGFPHTDPFTYTFAGHTWIPQQWGGEVAMALAHQASGLDGLLLGFATLIAGLFAWLFSRMVASGMSPLLAGILTGACLFPGAFHYFIRPHMATIVGMAWVMACLIDFHRGKASVWRLVGLIPVCIVWTNIHGGVLGGVMTLGLAVAWWDLQFGLAWLRNKNTAELPIESWRKAFLLNGIVITCLLTPFVNPLGMEMLRTWQRIVGSTVMKQVVNEHKPLNLENAPDQLIAAFAVFYGLFLLGVLLKNWRDFRFLWVLPLVWFALTFQGIRQGPLFVIVAGVCLPDIWKHTLWHDLLKKYGDTLVTDEVHSTSLKWAALPACLVLLGLIIQSAGASVPVVGRGWAKLQPALVPTDLNEPLRRELALLAPGEQLFNDANLGGYLIYHFPQQKIFMDDRFELYGDAWTWDYVQLMQKYPERIDQLAAVHRFNLVLIGTCPGEETPLADYLAQVPQKWKPVAVGVGAKLYKRQN